MIEFEELVDRLRDHILGHMHAGQLARDERLPSIREIARRIGVDQRKVARAYRVLQAEGLVEIRGRSGVYVVSPSRLECGMLEETAEWLSGMLLEGWKRRIQLTELPALIGRYMTGSPIRCAFVDSCIDAIEAFSHELREELGLRVTPVNLRSLPRTGEGSPDGHLISTEAIRSADLIVTTIFNATSVGLLARRLEKQMITVSVHPQMVATVVRRLRKGPLTVVCVDPSFGDRIRLQYGEHLDHEARLRVVLADDRAAIATLDRDEPVLLTRAARSRLGDVELPMLIPHSPTLSPASTHEIIRSSIRLHARSGAEPAPAPHPGPERTGP